MKALILTLSLLVVYEAQAKEIVKENRAVAGHFTKKKKKESMWARGLREKLSGNSNFIRTW
jgi:hypothetical protein